MKNLNFYFYKSIIFSHFLPLPLQSNKKKNRYPYFLLFIFSPTEDRVNLQMQLFDQACLMHILNLHLNLSSSKVNSIKYQVHVYMINSSTRLGSL